MVRFSSYTSKQCYSESIRFCWKLDLFLCTLSVEDIQTVWLIRKNLSLQLLTRKDVMERFDKYDNTLYWFVRYSP